MLNIGITNNIEQAAQRLAAQQRQLPYALSLAINRTAQDVKQAEQQAMRTAFDRPTPYTLNSLYMRPSTKTRLQATVWVKDSDKPRHYLLPQVEGGDRPQKRMEFMLVRIGAMRRNERAVPGAGARLDQYGNVSRGQIQQILSQLRAFYLAGASQNASSTKRSRAKRAKEAYFVSTGPGTRPYGTGTWTNGRHVQHLPRGIWLRRSFGPLGTAIKPVFLFVGKATYRVRLDFNGVAAQVVAERLPLHLDAAISHALATARPTGGAP